MSAAVQQPGIGHNQPPGPQPVMVVDELADDLARDWKHKTDRRDELLAGFERFLAATAEGIGDDEQQGRASDFCKQIKDETKLCDGIREQVKAPVLQATRIVDGFWKGITDPLNQAAREIERRMTVYARDKADRARKAADEDRRRREDEAAKLAAEAERNATPEAIEKAIEAEQAALDAPVTPPKPADASRVHGDFGSVSSLRGRWTYRVTDRMALIKAIAVGEVSVDAVEVCDAWVKLQIKLRTKNGECTAVVAGLSFYRDEKVVVR